ncbi:hypothetical protein EW146_g6120 [Bondarzewia mesenterica]|uniref:Fe2OG dioxygenase domain-containing protein n=1 Tax=Bondarzewia mesenterica TaxID=1095465 RepID=A0A4S4LQJ1_9AGAM|nr:hypothetical protein EW146_g6120 [Bondarzewia mesenterica]
MSVTGDRLVLSIPNGLWLTRSDDEMSERNSLFDEMSEEDDCSPVRHNSSQANPSGSVPGVPARRRALPIPGLFFDPSVLLPPERAVDVFRKCIDTYFRDDENINQVMLFGRARAGVKDAPLESSPVDGAPSHQIPQANYGLPSFLRSLLSDLESLLRPSLPPLTHRLLFPPQSEPSRARQAIINLYRPGEGISPHVDLLSRFGDGIIGVSLGSGCVMSFVKEQTDSEAGSHDGAGPTDLAFEKDGHSVRWDLYLPERSILVLSEEARYEWTHGIDRRMEDWVGDNSEEGGDDAICFKRGLRMSITFRWLLPGAEVVGGDP